MRRLIMPLLILLPLISSGQFYYLGTSQPMENGCIMLTPDYPYAEGIAYSTTPLDIRYDFEIDFDIYLGNKEEGADGITFVIHNDPRGLEAFGTFGECLGYGRWSPNSEFGAFISPSIAIEFDTYFNPSQNDPEKDHVAYLENGTNYHFEGNKANTFPFNLEDDALHNFRFQWNATSGVIKVWLDNTLVYEIQEKLQNTIFKDMTDVYWGFTASTGRKHNLQYFCLKRITQYVTPTEGSETFTRSR